MDKKKVIKYVVITYAIAWALHSYTLKADSPIIGAALKDSGLRDHGLILISVRRGDSYISNPPADYVFAEGDTIWVTGSSAALEWLG